MKPVVAMIVAAATTAALAASSCGGPAPVAGPTVTSAAPSPDSGPEPGDRTVAVVTTACGSASAAIGSAVLLDERTVLTAAHVIAGADHVGVVANRKLPPDRSWPDFSPAQLLDGAAAAAIVAFDPGRDLALLSTVGDGVVRTELRSPELATAAADDAVEIHGVSTAPVVGVVAARTTIEADEVRGGSRVRRDGYRIDAPTGGGDSGAGVWSTDGHLVGLVFAVSSADDTRTWAVSGREIEGFLDAVADGPARSYRCDHATSQLVAGS
ncbi:MAG: serine protease [Acidimicrobiia bacterium]|nr:serine protease [Acidimicrobiia bacterium]